MGQNLCPSISPHTELDPDLISPSHLQYKSKPYLYLLQPLQRLHPNSPCQLFLQSVTSHYNAVPYHNITHGFDVMLMSDRLLVDYNMQRELNVTEQEKIYILLAAYAHDNGHQGLTNNFYINSEDPLALTYSNISPLQNLHSSNLLHALRTHNIPLSSQHKKLIVSLILATDNKHHFEMIRKLQLYQQQANQNIRNMLNDSKDDPPNASQAHLSPIKHKQTLLQMIIHTADLSPCGKPLPEYLKWNQRLYQEFKNQYTKQRQLKLKTLSFHFDLKNEDQSTANENLSFLNKMVLPFFKQVSIIIPQFSHQLSNAVRVRNHFEQKLKVIERKKPEMRVSRQKGGQGKQEKKKESK